MAPLDEVGRSKIVWKLEEPLNRTNFVFSDPFPERPRFNYRWRLRYNCRRRDSGYSMDIFAHKCNLAGTREVRDPRRHFSVFIQLLNSDGEVVKTKNYQSPLIRFASFGFHFNLVEATRHISTSMTIRCCVREYEYGAVPDDHCSLNSNSSGSNLNKTETSASCRQQVPNTGSSTASPSSIGPSSTNPIPPTKSSVENNYFADILKEMWREKILTDVSFVTNETVIRCHSSVLSAASPIFHNMFLNKGVSVIDLSDFYQPEAIEDTLSYVYTKECPNLSTTATQVIELSQIYHLGELEELCRKHIG